MMKPTWIGMALLLTLAVAGAAPSAPVKPVAIERLRCEYLENPLGIDVTRPRLSWNLMLGPRGRKQTAYQVLVARTPEALAKDRGDLWDSGRVKSEQSVFVEYAGRPLPSEVRCYWKVRVWDEEGRRSAWSQPANWSMGLLQDADWTAQWIGEARPAEVKEGRPLPFPWLRKTFTLDAKPRQATAFVKPLGYYELYVNGKKVDDHVLSPAVSDYSKRNLYVTHDIAEYLQPGKNCVALWLGRGWYVRGHEGVVHDGPLVRAQLHMAMPGGEPVRINTDTSWKLRESPLTPLGRGLAFGDYGGERYDARQELNNWNAVDLDDSGWQAATRFDPPKVITSPQMVQPNRIKETVPVISVKEVGPQSYMLQLAKNITGWFDLRLPDGIPAGASVKLEYSDIPPGNGPRWQIHNQRDEYISRGGAGQMFRSRFNYHGFGWVRVTGLPQAPSAADGKGSLIHTDYQPASEFTSSNEMLNQVYQFTSWTYRCLTLGGYVVDCPTRERLGYGGDAGTSHELGMTNFDTGGLYNRWLVNWRDAQHPTTGDLPFTAPAYQDRGGGGPMWSGFVVTLPWQIYVQYGDRRILETSYPSIQNWLRYLETENHGGLIEGHKSYKILLPEWTFLGDWLAPRPLNAPGGAFGGGGGGRRGVDDAEMARRRLINNCHYIYQLQLASRMAELLGKKTDASTYATRAQFLARTLHERYFNPNTRTYASGEQPYLAFPLLIGMVPSDLRDPVAATLAETIKTKDGGHINAGMHGTYFVLKYLLDSGRNDLIYEMVTKRDYPGWGYMLSQGATTAWESWQGGGSRIHDTLISVGHWFVQGVGGIRPDEKSPGFRHFYLTPAPIGDLTSARASHRSPYGVITSNWRIEGNTFHADVTVPPGSTATLLLPAGKMVDVKEGNGPASAAEEVRFLGKQGDKAAFELQSGQYSFTAPLVR